MYSGLYSRKSMLIVVFLFGGENIPVILVCI